MYHFLNNLVLIPGHFDWFQLSIVNNTRKIYFSWFFCVYTLLSLKEQFHLRTLYFSPIWVFAPISQTDALIK